MLRILLTYQYFLPAFKVGGPIQSIANICRELKEEFHFYIICSDTDKDDALLEGIKRNEWNDFEDNTARVYYLSRKERTKKRVNELIAEIQPDVIFVNGIYSPLFSISPLSFKKARSIISVRGMLHPGALTQKSLKKQIFIAGIKAFQLHKGCAYHATDPAEKSFIHKAFGKGKQVFVAQNFPKLISETAPVHKERGKLKMVSIALISPMKNILLVLEALQQTSGEIEYDIYGPVKDRQYWDKCVQLVHQIPPGVSVQYKGDLKPGELVETLDNYHFFVLPSKSENFGHAIYEALASGKPVITSHHTPWNGLYASKAGYNISINDPAELKEAIEKAACMPNKEYAAWSKASRRYALASVDVEKTKEDYRKMFITD